MIDLNTRDLYFALHFMLSDAVYGNVQSLMLDGIQKLLKTSLRVNGALEYSLVCHANLTKYFTYESRSRPKFYKVFVVNRPCYIQYRCEGIDLGRWREGD